MEWDLFFPLKIQVLLLFLPHLHLCWSLEPLKVILEDWNPLPDPCWCWHFDLFSWIMNVFNGIQNGGSLSEGFNLPFPDPLEEALFMVAIASWNLFLKIWKLKLLLVSLGCRIHKASWTLIMSSIKHASWQYLLPRDVRFRIVMLDTWN